MLTSRPRVACSRPWLSRQQAEKAELQAAKAPAPVSYAALHADPFLKKNIRQWTGFYSLESFDAWLDVCNADGLFEDINPSQDAHPCLGHDHHLYQINDEVSSRRVCHAPLQPTSPRAACVPRGVGPPGRLGCVALHTC